MSYVVFCINVLNCLKSADRAVHNTIVLAFLDAFKPESGVSSSFTGPGMWGRQCLTVLTTASNLFVDTASTPGVSMQDVAVNLMVRGERVDPHQLEAFIQKVLADLGAQQVVVFESRHVAERPVQAIAPHIIMCRRPAQTPVAA